MRPDRRAALPRLYLITDGALASAEAAAPASSALSGPIGAAIAAVPPGAIAVQLRAGAIAAGPLSQLAHRLRQVVGARGCPLFINDRVDVALAVGADGVHLPERGLDVATARALGGPDLLIGVSTHSPADAARAARDGADLIVLSPIWATPSKPGVPPLGLDALTAAAAQIGDAKLFALGGIDSPARARRARAAGAYGIAGIRGFSRRPTDTAALYQAVHHA